MNRDTSVLGTVAEKMKEKASKNRELKTVFRNLDLL